MAALWLGLRPASRWARRFLIVVVAAYALASLYVLPYSLSRLLVVGYHQFSSADVPKGRVAIVVLDAGTDFVANWDGQRLPYLGRIGSARMWEAIRVYRLMSDAWVLSSESIPAEWPGTAPPATPQHDALVHLDVPSSRVVAAPGALDTHDEAVRIGPIVRSLGADRTVLVTSDIHMRRALATFRAQGVDAIPAIVRDPELAHDWRDWVLPSPQGLGLSGRVVHEVMGIAYYAITGRLRF